MQNIPLAKIKSLENEVKALKYLGKKSLLKKGKKSKFSSIEGILKGVKFSEKDIEEAKYKFDYNHIIHQTHKK
jgi:hypothetical protein